MSIISVQNQQEDLVNLAIHTALLDHPIIVSSTKIDLHVRSHCTTCTCKSKIIFYFIIHTITNTER